MHESSDVASCYVTRARTKASIVAAPHQRATALLLAMSRKRVDL